MKKFGSIPSRDEQNRQIDSFTDLQVHRSLTVGFEYTSLPGFSHVKLIRSTQRQRERGFNYAA